MTEFEAATVAYQNAMLAHQTAALALQQGQLWAAVAIPLVAGLVGVGQILVVLKGIGVMDRANRNRARSGRRQAVRLH